MTDLPKSLHKSAVLAAVLVASATMPLAAPAVGTSVVDGRDYGPLAGLIGTWKSASTGGVDVAPGRAGSKEGEDKPAVSPFFETIKFSQAGDALNASEQHLAALYYRQQVFRKSDNKQFHDQTGYLIYDKKNQRVYDASVFPAPSASWPRARPAPR